MEIEFLELMEQQQGIIHKICRLYRSSPEDRQDLFQETVFQLWKSYPQFKRQADVSTWLYRVALNTALATFRKPRPAITYSDAPPELAAEANAINEQEEQLYMALQQLNDAEKAFMALYLEDFSYREIAEVLGISENNVGVRLNRIKSKLKQTLKA
ncbi:RNA polymerase sigma factor [Pontibacter harenae]|uniref:RNA polymerase sigma factor n=1 Tax=Pontibacter harenae TaxID=2894083 RepID=UPI001E59ADB1|nr:sigma-70 family RNA polymerase sigma factor [Pontibacter harenae]MCC9165626.1 sigma-70 family RNA polymerase sigma factor [Pontibacter harenae]